MIFQKRSLRFSCVFLILIFLLLSFSVKLILIQIFRSEHLNNLAERQHNHYVEIEPIRGTIYDRRLRPLALNVSVYSLYANPRKMTASQKEDAARQLAPILGIQQAVLRQKLNREKYFIWLARKLPLDQVEKIKDLKLRGTDFIKESKRYYPDESLAAHVIGFAGMDNQGLEGLELSYNRFLKGKAGWSKILRDARQNDLLIEKGFIPPQDGFNLVLTIDETIQFIAEEALERAFERYNALSASIIVMDPRTGEVLALANRPTYNLADFSKSSAESRTNRAIAHVYEPGSVFKIVAASAALEEEIFEEQDKIFCENGEYRVGNHILHDHHPFGMLTFQEVIEQSSNIGTTKIAQKMGPERFYKYAKRFRFGERTAIDLKGEVSGWMKDPSQWSSTSIGAIPIGQEVTVTPLQLVCAISAVANDGVMMKPFVVKYIKDNKDELIHKCEPEMVDRVMSVDTARRVRKILEGVVERGTGKRAQIKGTSVGGKTGTAQKVVNGRYSNNKYYASFIGFAPADDPLVAVAVVVNEPHPSHYGGTVAAPVFKEVVASSLKYLQAIEYGF